MRERLVCGLAFACAVGLGAPPDGEALYKQRCARCHDAVQPRTPTRKDLGGRSEQAILVAISEGGMKGFAAGLSAPEQHAIARVLAAKTVAPGAIGGRCPSAGTFQLTDSGWNGWGRDLANTRYQPNPGLGVADVPRLRLKWAFAFPGDTVRSAQPAVIGGRVFVGSAQGGVYSLDANTGCTYWRYDAGVMVRTAVSVGSAGGKLIAWFGDVRSVVHAVDATTGETLWKAKVEDHPSARITGAPAFYNGRLYVPVSSIEEASAAAPGYECCSFRGSIVALDGATGRRVWKSYAIAEKGPAGAAIWSAPTIDIEKKVLYAATGNSYTNAATSTTDAILAFDLETGVLKWSSQVKAKDNYTIACDRGGPACPEERGPDHDFGSSPILRSLPGGKRVLICGQKSGIVWGMDPDDGGKILWQTRVGRGGALGGIEWGPSADAEYAYVAVSDLLTRPSGGLHAIRLATGERVWSKMPAELRCTPGAKGCNSAQSAAISSMPGVVFSGSIDGHLRAYDSGTGAVVWDFDTAREFETVNGVAGRGGSLDAAGPVISEGMVFTNSGYGMWQGMPGNVLLAFGL